VSRRPPGPRWLLLTAAALAAAGAGACITVPEFRALEREVEELQAGGETGGGARLAELGADVEALEREVAKLRGEIERAQHAAEDARRIAEEAQQAVQAARSAKDPAASAPSGAVAGAPGEPSLESPLGQEIRDYEQGFSLYAEGRYADAIDRFRTFLQNYPSSDYADNALFWIGECQFRLGEYERAVLTFEDVVKRHPDGNKVADALYRQGVSLLEIGKRNKEERVYGSAAREIFERIVKEFPESERVSEAKVQLEKLRL
jgi:tol-pal system protein YbgF